MPQNIQNPLVFDNGSKPSYAHGDGTRVNLASGAASANAAIPAGARVVKVTATENCWLNFGTSGVTASAANTSILFLAGVDIIYLPSTVTHVAAIQFATAGTVQLERVG